MRGIASLVATALLVSIAVTPSSAGEKQGSFTEHSYTNDAGTRRYMLYVPSKVAQPATPLVVYLHGCNQTAADAAVGTRFNDLAEAEGFVVVYPEQDRAANGAGCWNWFLPEHQQRGSGEASIIAGITQAVADEYRIDPGHVFVFGASAGGVMAGNMGATYPDLYAAIGVLAGCAYASCSDVSGELAYRAMGEHARPVPTIVFQGTADTLVVYPLGRTVLNQWLGTNDLADDGSRNGSVAQTPSEIENRSFDQQPQPGTGDPCVRPNRFPCPGGIVGFGEYPHTIERYHDADGDTLVEFWSIHGLEHAYPGGDPNGTFTDPLGPNVTRASYEFFMAHAAARN